MNSLEQRPSLSIETLITPVAPAIRLVFFDIDGTLLDPSGHYSESLKQQIARIQALGVKTAIASGRPHFAAQFLMDELALTDPGVFCTGAYIYDPLKQQVLLAEPIEPSQATAFLQVLRSSKMYYELYTENGHYVETSVGENIRKSHAEHLRARAILGEYSDALLATPATKFLVGAPGDDGLATLKCLEAQFPDLNFAYAQFPAHPDWYFASVIHSSACKKRAFSYLLNQYGLNAEQVASFGDSHSDMTFLSLAGHGVAMGNASAEVKAAARWVTDCAEQDGVAKALARLI